MRLIGHCATTNTQILSSSILIHMCVTFMSFTMAWNNPPSAPHSFSTDSMVSETNKKRSQRDKDQMKYPIAGAFSNIRNEDLASVHPPFLVLLLQQR